ncbi:unnamed protein product [Pleuronectes platessa]|uniref:Uncharacterized protein n=1 Tax=Pleuronectes platessa TaxID=8262 RepID=A0A9N7TQ14_PLEPL|nr:unnamed protein product [Pleuronectes platessa]
MAHSSGSIRYRREETVAPASSRHVTRAAILRMVWWNSRVNSTPLNRRQYMKTEPVTNQNPAQLGGNASQGGKPSRLLPATNLISAKRRGLAVRNFVKVSDNYPTMISPPILPANADKLRSLEIVPLYIFLRQ